MATVVNIDEAKTHLSRIVEEVAAGAEVIISKAGRPMVRMSAITRPVKEKQLGLLEGKIKVAHDFNAPLDAATLSDFEGR